MFGIFYFALKIMKPDIIYYRLLKEQYNPHPHHLLQLVWLGEGAGHLQHSVRGDPAGQVEEGVRAGARISRKNSHMQNALITVLPRLAGTIRRKFISFHLGDREGTGPCPTPSLDWTGELGMGWRGVCRMSMDGGVDDGEWGRRSFDR